MQKLVVLIGLAFICANGVCARNGGNGKALLLVAYGTCSPEGRKAYANIEKAAVKKFNDRKVVWAFTSSFVLRKMKQKGQKAFSVSEALDGLKNSGVTDVCVQSLHVVPGGEFDKIRDAVKQNKKSFGKICTGKPLLYSYHDLQTLTGIFQSIIPAARKSNDAVVIMGHGSEDGCCDLNYIAAACEFSNIDRKIFLGTVEGAMRIGEVKKRVLESGAKKAFLMPLLIVAGNHAKEDLAGDGKESWKSVLEREGVKCVPVMKGLGEYGKVAELFMKHAEAAIDSAEEQK
jgi:sirohydrochlorin cobaltochelatase